MQQLTGTTAARRNAEVDPLKRMRFIDRHRDESDFFSFPVSIIRRDARFAGMST